MRFHFITSIISFSISMSFVSFAQISGTKSIPGDYATIEAAIAALNASGVGTGGVTFNVAAGHTETFSISTAGTLTATGTAENPIVFQKSGAGSNPLITAASGGGATDGIIEIAGGDYITFDAIDVVDPLSNASSTNRMEWGYALVKKNNAAPFDGCQHVTIRNCAITLQKVHTATIGIECSNHTAASTATLVIAATTDAMNNCKIYGNTISNVYIGIKAYGYNASSPYTLYNQGNEIGVDGGNIITDFGGASNTSYGIYAQYESGIKIANNVINGGTGSTGTLYGIYLGTATNASGDIYGNTVTIAGSGTTSVNSGIYNTAGASGSGNTINIYNNIVENCTYSTATSGAFRAIYSSAGISTLSIHGNIIRNNTQAGTGEFIGIDTGDPVNLNIYENDIYGNQKTGTDGLMCLVRGGLSAIDFHSNSIYNNGFSNASGTSPASVYGFYNADLAPSEDNYDNQIYNLYVTGTNTSTSSVMTAIHTTAAASAVKAVYENQVHGLNALTGAVTGIYHSGGSSVNIYRNNLYDIQSGSTLTSGPAVNGILINSGSNVAVYNNFISDLRAPSAGSSDGIRGVSFPSAPANSSFGFYYNTIYLNASSTGTNFGTSGVFHTYSATATSGSLDMRNNNIVNVSTPSGTGYTVAFRRSSSSSLVNYSGTSDNNNFYSGIPGAYNVIFLAGSTVKQTIEEFKAYVGPNRDSLSFSENPPFINTGTPPYNLHLLSSSPSFCESGGTVVMTPFEITQDYDLETRYGATGYAGTGNAPDVGADELEGITAYVGVPASFVATPYNSQRIDLAFSPNGNNDDVVIIYNLTGTFTAPAGSPVIGQPMGGGTVIYAGQGSSYQHTGLATGTTYYYQAFAYNGLNYSLPLSDSGIPGVIPPSGFNAMTYNQERIDLYWNLNQSGQDVLLAYNSTNTFGTPTGTYGVNDPITGGGTVIYSGNATSFNHTGLTPWTHYFYKLWTRDELNAYSTGVTDDEKTYADTVDEFPYLQNFDGAWSDSPAAPYGWEVINVEGDFYTWKQTNAYYHSSPYSALGIGSQDDYLISPPINLAGIDPLIEWWDKVQSTIGSNSYKVLLSNTDNQLSSFNVELGDYTCTNSSWASHSIDLAAYSGQTVFIAFHQYYSSTTYNSFCIDDIQVMDKKPQPATLIYPPIDFLSLLDPVLSWAAPTTGAAPSGYKIYLEANPSPDSLVYDGANLGWQATGLSYNTNYYWKVVPYNTYGNALNVPVWSFNTVSITQLGESFEAAYFPPVGWSMDGSSWTISTTTHYHGNQSARRLTTTAPVKLITPMLSISSGDSLAFFSFTSMTNQKIQVLYSSDKSSWTNLGSPIDLINNSWQYQKIDLSPLTGGNYYLAIAPYYSGGSSAYVYIDHVTGPEVVPVLPAAATNPGPADLDGYIETSPVLTWNPGLNGGIPTGYKVYLDDNPDPATLIYNGTFPTCQASTPGYNTTYYWKVVPYNAVGDAAACPVWSFTTVPEGGVQIGRELLSYLNLPIHTDYNYSYSQVLYLQTEINISGRRIDKIWYYWNGAEIGENYKDWAIYMGLTTKTDFTSLTDWIPLAQMTKVFEGEVNVPADEGWVEIFLDVPFDYNNTDNLVVAVDENTDGYSNSGNAYFYGSEASANRGMNYYDDSTNPDPAGPPTADNLVQGYPDIRLKLETPPATPVFYANPGSKDFGTVNLFGSSDPQVFSIRNRGTGTLVINSLGLGGTDVGHFQLSDTNTYPKSLTANQSLVVSVTFSPATQGSKTASLDISDNLGSRTLHQLPLTGIGFDALVQAFPYTETFEDTSMTRAMWTQEYVSGTGDWTFGTGAANGTITLAHTGEKNARFTGTPNANVTKLISPVLNIATMTNPEVVFWYGQENWSGDQNELKIYYRTASNQPWVQLFHDNAIQEDWTFNYVSLPNPTSTYQLAFEGIDLYGYPNVLDDVTVQESPGPRTMWTGVVSTDWNDAGNWNNGVPGVNSVVTIDRGNHDPVISASVTIHMLTLSNGSGITLQSPAILTVTAP